MRLAGGIAYYETRIKNEPRRGYEFLALQFYAAYAHILPIFSQSSGSRVWEFGLLN
jgi:hypothetical protein